MKNVHSFGPFVSKPPRPTWQTHTVVDPSKPVTYRGAIVQDLQTLWHCDHEHESREAAEACARNR